jgi:hypothetical protein
LSPPVLNISSSALPDAEIDEEIIIAGAITKRAESTRVSVYTVPTGVVARIVVVASELEGGRSVDPSRLGG